MSEYKGVAFDKTWNAASVSAGSGYKHNGIPMPAPTDNETWERSTMKFLSSKMEEEEKRIGSIDPEDVRRLTQGMKRENWCAPRNLTSEQIAVAYLKQWGTAMFHEFASHGISAHVLRKMIRGGVLKCETLPVKGSPLEYSLV